MDNKEVLAEVNGLIALCKDSEDAYRQVAEAAISQEFTTMFHRYAKERAQMAADLQQEVIRLGEQPEDEGTLVAAIRRGWFDLKTALASEDAGTRRRLILDECVGSETQVQEQYADVLKRGIPTPIRDMVKQQFDQIQETLRSLESMKEG